MGKIEAQAQNTEKTLNLIYNTISNIREFNTDISNGTNEQNELITKINAINEKLTTIKNSNSNLANHSNSSILELSLMAQQLGGIVKQFTSSDKKTNMADNSLEAIDEHILF